MLRKTVNTTLLIIIIIPMICSLFIVRFIPDTDYNFVAWSLLPPLVAIFLAFITKQVFLSLFLGVYTGATMLIPGSIITKLTKGYMVTFELAVESVADKFHAGIIIFTLTIGGMIGIISRMGGTKAIAQAMARNVNSARSAQVFTSLLGVLVFFDDYANTLIVGPTMMPLTDANRVSREKLSYIVDSTAAPVAGIALISTWIGYELGLINDALKAVGINANAYEIFLRSIPFRFYDILAITLVFMVGFMLRDFGPMYKAESRARKTGKVISDGAILMSKLDLGSDKVSRDVKLRVSNALVPILVLLMLSLVGLWYHGGGTKLPFTLNGIRDAFGAADASVALIWGSTAAAIAAIIMAISRKILTLHETFEAFVDGSKSLLITIIILVFAWSLGLITKKLGTATYLVSVVSGTLPGWLLPMVVFSISCLISFATGTSWGTMAIMMPLAIPLANAYAPGSMGNVFLGTVGAVLTGSIFGDHCSPISDTTIMSSMASSCDHIDHVNTQIPYAVTTAAAALLLGYIPCGLGVNPFLSLILGCISILFIIRFFGKSTAEEPAPVS